MQIWRFFQPGALGFTLRTVTQSAIDKIRGAPPRTTQAASYVSLHARPGDPEDVLRTLDKFATEERWLMSVGPEKGPLVKEMVGRLPANARILELGAYCGYSSILLAHAFGSAARIVSVEIDENSVASTRSNLAVAGLSDRVTVIHGRSSEIIARLDGTFDLVFLDHWKDLYLPDLELIEQRQLIKPGSVVVADNVGEIFHPEAYLDYVRNCGHYQSENRPATIEYTTVPDAVEISVYQP